MTKLQRFEQANHFEFSGEGLSGMLDTNSIDGQPLGSVTVDGVEGRMVSIRQGPGGWHLDAELVAIPDLSVETVQVVLPQVNLEGEAVSFNGYAVLLTTRGNPFSRQERIGQNGRLYRMWKLRSMVPDADAALSRLLAEDQP